MTTTSTRKRDSVTLRPLTIEELDALLRFAARYESRTGRVDWKSDLVTAWNRGLVMEIGAVLYRLRNTHGGAWLSEFELPEWGQAVTCDHHGASFQTPDQHCDKCEDERSEAAHPGIDADGRAALRAIEALRGRAWGDVQSASSPQRRRSTRPCSTSATTRR